MSCAPRRKRATPLMDNPADLCRECELRQRIIDLEEINKSSFSALTYLYEMALKLTEENRALKLRLEEEE